MQPPLHYDPGFYKDSNNLLKIFEILFGICSLGCGIFCYPNPTSLECTAGCQSVQQLFILFCVIGFLLLSTALLLICNMCSVPDAYYRYNFPVLERMFATLSTALYGSAVIIHLTYLCTIHFSSRWLFSTFFLVSTFILYTYDAYNRWKSDYN